MIHFLQLITLAVAVAGSGEMDAASQEVLEKTKLLLRDSNARKQAVAKDPKAKETDKHVKNLAGSEKTTEEIYDLSADIMDTITRQAGGDVDKMQALLLEAMRDPTAFAAKFTPEQKAKLKAISEKVPDPSPKKSRP